jgi:hypothetical protein
LEKTPDNYVIRHAMLTHVKPNDEPTGPVERRVGRHGFGGAGLSEEW